MPWNNQSGGGGWKSGGGNGGGRGARAPAVADNRPISKRC